MHVQAPMSGQVSGQVPSQAGSQLPALSQQNGISLPSQLQNLGGLHSSLIMDHEFREVRKQMLERIYHLLMRQAQANQEMQPKIPGIARRLEELLCRDAASKEEYMNLDTLELRLHSLIKRAPANKHNQQMSSSPSIGMMIPTPGMPQSGNSNPTVTSSINNSVVAGSACGTITPNTVNSNSLLPSTNGSSGSLPNGYQQLSANVPIGSGGNNMISSMGVQRIASQMIPTPGLVSNQSNMNSESCNSVGGFSSVEATIVSQQHQQPKQYIGGQNRSVLHNLGGQMNTNMRSSLHPKPSSYQFSNGALNGGMGLVGNNIQLINGPAASEGYLTASSYALSQQMNPSGSDGYGISAADLSGPGNLYGPTTSVAPMINNQNINTVTLQCKSKTNSPLIANQTNLQAIQQTPYIKVQTTDQSPKMNFQSSNLNREHLSQQQLQKLQSQPLQFQQQQFLQHQHQQKQQSQQHLNLLSKNDVFRQPQLSSSLGGQAMPEHVMESHNEVLHSLVPEQFQLSDLQDQFQQSASEDHSRCTQLVSHPSGPADFYLSVSNNSKQMPQIMHPHQQVADLHSDFSCISSGVHSEPLLQGQSHSEKQKSHIPDQSCHEQRVKEFCQGVTGQDEAQKPHLSSEGSISGQGSLSKGSAVRFASRGSACRPGNVTLERQWLNQQRWLLFLWHARGCSAPEGKCQAVHCITAQKLWRHMARCTVHQCPYPRCHVTKGLVQHYRSCKGSECPVCVPVNNYLRSHKARARSFSETSLSNQISGSWKSFETSDVSRLTSKSSPSTGEISEDLQSSMKRIKMEHHSPSVMPKGEGSPVSVFPMSQQHVSQDAQPTICQQVDVSMPVKCEVMEVKMEPSLSSVGGGSPNLSEKKENTFDACYTMKPEVELVIPNESVGVSKMDSMEVEKKIDQAKQEMKQESVMIPSENVSGTKSGKPKIKGVSLTELFTPEQIREHIRGLRQWVGQSKSKAEKNQAMEHSMSENSCQLCAVEKLTFEPPPIYCTPCGARIKRNAMYYTVGTGDTRHYFCIPCYNEARSDTIEVDGTAILKSRMEKKRNDEETEEWWVQCDKCEAWQHQICALFNGRRNDGGQAEYTCPNCYIGEIERGERKPLPQSAVLGAKDLPRTILSDHIEQRLFRQLKQERQERARLLGKNFDEVQGAEALVIRVVSSVDKKLEVKQRFLEIFQEENYPTEFPYKSKAILLFQKIEGVEVCLFGMYVQEFGSECAFPNQRRVYLSYLDSVKYFRPEIKTVTGEALRTFVYHEILIGYLEYCKKRGFTSCYIWACPPLKGEDYILYCHPEIQKTPKSDKLREWYLSMLRKAAKENIVVDVINLYDHFFVSSGECKAKVTAARLPYFDGDYWPGAAEDMINLLRQEEDGRKQQKKGKTKKTITKRALKAAGQTDLSGNASKDVLLMQKLGETISPMKEDFIMVHLQHACTHCCHLMVSGNRWICNQCKNFQLCDRCHDAEQKLEERERHPFNSREKHALYPVEINDVPGDTKDKDEILESEFFDTRQAFLSLCQGNHYQYDTLRRAKHSSMMVLYHLHNPTAPAFVTTCNICHHDIEAGQGWRCEICPDYDVCNNCYQKDGGVEHPHKLTNHPSMADRDAQNKEARQKRVLQLRKMLDLLVHASQCRSPHCQYPNCRKVKGLFRHGIQCKTRASGGCLLCKKMWYLLQLHARACKESECHVPRCRDLREHLRRLQQQSDSRRRAAVMEMMRQRAAEVAGNTG